MISFIKNISFGGVYFSILHLVFVAANFGPQQQHCRG
jgi:hypothetical protein